MTPLKKALCFGVLTLSLGASVAVAQMQGMDMQKMMQSMSPASNDPASTKDLKQAHMNMMKNMNMQFTGNTDTDFARSMIPHHQGAIDMARVQLKYGKNPELRKMAEKMIKDQEREQKELQTFLQKQKEINR